MFPNPARCPPAASDRESARTTSGSWGPRAWSRARSSRWRRWRRGSPRAVPRVWTRSSRSASNERQTASDLENRREISRDLERERSHRATRMPHQGVCDELGPRVSRTPSLEQPRVEVDDPVVRYVPLVHGAFAHAVVAATGWGQYFDRQQELADGEPLTHDAAPVGRWNYEHVRLCDELRLQFDV